MAAGQAPWRFSPADRARARKRGHLRFAQSLGGMYHREWIPAQRICREDIDLRERLTHQRRLTFTLTGAPLRAASRSALLYARPVGRAVRRHAFRVHDWSAFDPRATHQLKQMRLDGKHFPLP